MPETTTSIFLFYPNLVGYARIILALIAFHAMVDNPWRAAVCYFLSAFLDAFDGYLARQFDQGAQLSCDRVLNTAITILSLCRVTRMKVKIHVALAI